MKDIKETAKRLNVSEEDIKSVLNSLGDDVTDEEILEALTSENVVSKPALKPAPVKESEVTKMVQETEESDTGKEESHVTIGDATVEEAREQARYQAALFAKNYKDTFDAETERLLGIHLDMKRRDFDEFVEKELARPAVRPIHYKKKARPSLDYKAMGLM